MEDDYTRYWNAKRLSGVASKAILHASRRIRARLPAAVALQRSECLNRLANEAWAKVSA